MNLIQDKDKPCTVARILAGIYLLAVIAAFFLMLATLRSTAMSGIFLVLATLPWPMVLDQLQNFFQLDSALFNGLFLLAGGVVNSFLLYKMFSFIECFLKR